MRSASARSAIVRATFNTRWYAVTGQLAPADRFAHDVVVPVREAKAVDDPLLQVAPGEKLRAELGKRGDPVEHETDAPLQTAKWDRLWDEHDPAVGPAISAELSVKTPKVDLVL